MAVNLPKFACNQEEVQGRWKICCACRKRAVAGAFERTSLDQDVDDVSLHARTCVETVFVGTTAM